MKYYLDIDLRPDSEITIGFLWQKVYQQIHIALADNKTNMGNSVIAVSFPEYGNKVFPLGSKLRLLAKSQEQLIKLDAAKWLNRLTDYTHCTSVKEVPQNVVQHVCFSRPNIKSNFLKKAQRRAEHLKKPLEDVIAYMQAEDKERGISYESKLPFINTQSLSSQGKVPDRFRLFVKKSLMNDEKVGEFSCYGLSKTATVPWF